MAIVAFSHVLTGRSGNEDLHDFHSLIGSIEGIARHRQKRQTFTDEGPSR
jgi:hypothetical protein